MGDMLLNAFVVGGIICVLAQLLMDLTSYKITPGHILVGLVVTGAILSAIGLYSPLVKLGGAGATVPLSGFGHALAQGTLKAVAAEGFLGVFTGGVTATSGGILAATVFGYLMAVTFNPKG
ncbi:MAG: stage V sporulation protein AE [Methylocystaceae bacterium]